MTSATPMSAITTTNVPSSVETVDAAAIPKLGHDEAMALAETEFARTVQLLH
jgi:hypothetical protein